MKSAARMNWALGALVGMALVAIAGVAMSDPPESPKISTFAPVKDLDSQIEAYVGRLEESVKSEDEYKDAAGKISKDANTLILLGMAAGQHDGDSKYKDAASALVKAAEDLAGAKDFASAKAGVEAVKKALDAKAGGTVKWEKKASLDQLMKQVPLVNNRLKRNVKTEKTLKSKAKDNAGDSAVLAVIAQGSMVDTSEAKGEDQAKQWYKFCEQMRDAAAKVNAGVHAGNFQDVQAAMKDLNKSCDDCHEVFHKGGKTEGGDEK